MKILFLTDNFPPEVNAPATRTYEHCCEWVKAGHEVTVITCFPNYPTGKVYQGYKNSLFGKTESMNGIKVIRVWSYMTANKGFAKRILDFISFSVTSFFAGLFQSCDVIIATSPQFFTALSGRTLHGFKRKPWIMEVRDLWPDSIKAVGAMKGNFILYYFSKEEKWCYKSADKIVVVTNSFKRDIIAKGIPANKIHIIKNGANTELFKPREKSQELLERHHLKGKKVLGYIGTLGMAHKIDFLIDSIKGSSEYVLMILGNGAERENLEKKIQEERISNVVLLDSVPKHEVPDYIALQDAALINLRKSDLFKTVIPSKIFETSAMRIPILLGVDGEAREMIEEFGAGIYYEPENMDDFKTKLDYLFSSKEVYQSCQKGGEQLAKAYDRKRLAAEMLEIIQQ